MAKPNRKKPDIEPFSVRSAHRSSAPRPLVEPATAWAIGIFALVTLAFFWGHLFGGAWLWEDFSEFTYPNEVFAARSFAAEILPFWNPFTFCGMPFLADLQIGFFYPGNILMYLFSGGELSAWLAQAFVMVHYFIAMVAIWRLARWIGIGQWGAILAGITYALSGILVAHMIHPNMIHHLAWFPLIVYLFHRGLTTRSLLHSLLAGLLLGCVMLSGHPQSTLYIVFFLLCLTIFQVVREMRSSEKPVTSSLVRAALLAALPIVIGSGIFAIQLLPSQELAGLSERAVMPYEKTLDGAMGVGQIFTLVVPKLFGVSSAEPVAGSAFWYRPEIYYFWETAIYIGVVGLLLAVIGLGSTRLGALRWFLGGMALLGILYALGDSFLVHPILSKFPLFGTFRSPARLAMYLSLGGALLAGAGLERVIRREESGGKLMRTTLVAGGIIVLIGLLTVSGTLAAMFNAPSEAIDAVSRTGIVPLLVGALSVAIIWAVLKGKMPAGGGAVALILLAAIDLFIFGVHQNAGLNNPQEIYKYNDDQFATFKASPPDKLFRVRMRDRGMLMQRNQGPYSGIMLFEGYNPLLLERRVPPAATPEKAYDFMNIRYGIQVDPASGAAGLAERPTAYPHARILYDAKMVDTAEAKRLLKSDEVDFTKTVLLENAPGSTAQAPPRLDGAGTGSASITRYEADEIEVKATTDRPGILVLSEVWYPAWKAYIDGAESPIYIADYSLRGIAIPAGAHTVTLRYESSAFSTGMWITLVTLLATLGAIAWTVMKSRGVEKSRSRESAEPAGEL